MASVADCSPAEVIRQLQLQAGDENHGRPSDAPETHENEGGFNPSSAAQPRDTGKPHGGQNKVYQPNAGIEYPQPQNGAGYSGDNRGNEEHGPEKGKPSYSLIQQKSQEQRQAQP